MILPHTKKGDWTMSTVSTQPLPGALTELVTEVRKIWGWFLALGIIQIVVGALAVSFAFSATLASVLTLGILLLIAAGAQLVAAIWTRDWGGFFLYVLIGLLYAVAGFLTIQQPLLAAETLTLMLAAALLLGGMFRIVVAAVERFPAWGWVLVNGIISVVLGVLIWQQWPVSGLWVLGMFVGIDLIVNGVNWSILAIAVRNGAAQFGVPLRQWRA
jgi:uncharacterized membrane protein HdeD (DUF308 family)